MTAVARPADVTVGWLSGIVGTAVSGFTLERIGTGQISECYRVALTYPQGSPGPASVVLKVAAGDATSRQTGLALGLYEREVRLYTDIAPRLSAAPVAPCSHAAFDPETGVFDLVLGDAAPALVGDEIRGATIEQAHLAVGELARLQAPLLGDATLAGADWLTRESPLNPGTGRSALRRVRQPLRRIDDARPTQGLRTTRRRLRRLSGPGSYAGSPAHLATDEPLWSESWYGDFVDPEQRVGGWVRLGLIPNQNAAWLRALLCGPDMPTIAISDFAAALPENAWTLRTDDIEFSHAATIPLRTYTVALHGRGQAYDDPSALLRGGAGWPVAMSLELEWNTDGTPYQASAIASRQRHRLSSCRRPKPGRRSRPTGYR